METSAPRFRSPKWARNGAAFVAVAALIAVIVPGSAASAAVLSPYADPFYAQSGALTSVANGTVLAARQVTLVTPTQAVLPLTAYELKYRSQDSLGRPVADVTTVILPLNRAAGPTPVLSYQVAEDSLGMPCAPSYSLRAGATTVSGAEQFLIMLALQQGWVVSVPDYEGPYSQYTAGVQAGHAALDAVRATENYAATGTTAASPVGFWGYSGGGQATAWAGELQGSYAPELNVVGIAEGGVPSDVGSVIKATDGTPLAGEEFGSIIGLSRAYPSASLGPVLNSTGRSVVYSAATACTSAMLASFAGRSIDDLTTVPNAVDLPSFAAVLHADSLGQNAPDAPVFAYHAVNDEIIPVAQADALQAWYCSQGVADYYDRVPVGGHVQTLLSAASSALQWLSDRFAGVPAPTNC